MQTGYRNVRAVYRKEMQSVERDAQCRNLSMQGSVRNAGVQPRRFRRAQIHHERPRNCVVGGKGMWVGSKMGQGREKRSIDEAGRPHTAGGGTLWS